MGALTGFSLGSAVVGRVVEVKTSEAIYYVTRVNGGKPAGDLFYGLMIHCTAGTNIKTAPHETFAEAAIRVGETWHVNGRPTRGKVTEIRSLS